MKPVKFTVQTSWLIAGARIRVIVHPNGKALREATSDPLAAGVCQRWTFKTFDGKGKEIPSKIDHRVHANIHLHSDALGVGVISHESTHAAIQLFETAHGLGKLAIGEDSPVGTDSLEEQFAYTVGDIVSKIYKQLYKREIIK